MTESKDNYVTVRLPSEITKKIDQIIKDDSHGYTSRAEFVKEALRLRIETLRRISMVEKKLREA